LHPRVVDARAAGGADRRHLRGGRRRRDPHDRPRPAGRRAPQADPDRQHPHRRPRRPQGHRAALRRGRIGPLAAAPAARPGSFGVVVASSVALAGVLLGFSFLIIPASVGVLYAETLARRLAIGWSAGTVTSAAGLAASFAFDLPTGAAMVCAFGAALALAGLLCPFLRGDARTAAHRAAAALRWCLAVVLAGSGLLLMLAPRADQPLLDAAQ